MWDVDAIRSDFPILQSTVYGRPLVYLDNSATTHKPRPVLEALQEYYTQMNSNVHRSAHYLSQMASDAYEESRVILRDFIGASSPREIVFTSGTTEAINLVAQCYCRPRLQTGDNIVVSAMEHHSNLVPWQMLCKSAGASLKVIPLKDDGSLDIAAGEKLITGNTRMLALTAVSNVLGTINRLERLIGVAHAHGAAVTIDGAQAVPHQRVDVQSLDCDFYAFSGHKLYADTGIGVLYGKKAKLEAMDPWQYGGGMVGNVDYERTTFADPPYRFEAGTRHTAGAVSLAAAIRYLEQLGWDDLAGHEQRVLEYALQRLSEDERITVYGPAGHRHGVISFRLDGIQCFDAASILDKMGIAVRSGHHCAEPLMKHLGIDGTVRASLGCYNTREEVDVLVEGIERVRQMLA
ncbi:MAG: aminotransferase class V-fold PLP-dependent enzyme [Phycisphaerae bacterium]